MGCGCKGDTPKEISNEISKVDLNIKGQILRIPAAIVLTIIFIVLAPFLVIYIWYLSMLYVFGKDATILKGLLKRFNKNKDGEEFEEDFDESDYEIEGLEVIK